MLESVLVKELTTLEQIEEARELEYMIWATERIPAHQTIAFSRNGGFVLGAYLGEELIGFSYSCPGYVDGEVYLYSHLLGIKREYREKGVGELIKIFQKDIAIERGYTKCRWLFDPLEARTAYLNFAKLGVFSDTYIANCYGELEDPFNRLLPTDRVFVEWQLVDNDYLRWNAKVEELLEEAQPIVDWSLNADDLPVLDENEVFSKDMEITGDAYLLPTPYYFQRIKIENPTLAEDWRYKTRDILQEVFARGYLIIHLAKDNMHVNQYVLVKRSLFAL
ncbi:MAG: GNAT family N-acetyltransferase [Solibacillus sp.]